jgi:uncharacterized protein (TIGR00251 family)
VLRDRLVKEGEMVFSVRVRPGASRTQVKDVLTSGTVKIDLAAAPEGGKANAELIRFLAEEFGVPKSHVEILKGQTTRMKTVRVRS